MTAHSLTTRHLWHWLAAHRGRLMVLFLGILIPLTLVGILAEDVLEQEGFFFDTPILLFMHQHATPARDAVMRGASVAGSIGGVVPVDALVLLGLLILRRWRDGAFWLLAVGGSGLLNLAAKQVFGRVRPALWVSIAPEQSYSFPSGHAMAAMALVAALAVLVWPTRWRWPVLILGGTFAVLVGLSRVYLGVHYPSDIVAGWAASLAWVLGISLLVTRHPPAAAPHTTTTR